MSERALWSWVRALRSWAFLLLGALSLLLIGAAGELPPWRDGVTGVLTWAAMSAAVWLAALLFWGVTVLMIIGEGGGSKWVARAGRAIVILTWAILLLWSRWAPWVARQDWAPTWVVEANWRLEEQYCMEKAPELMARCFDQLAK